MCAHMLWIETKAATVGQAIASASNTSAASRRESPAPPIVLGHVHRGEAEVGRLAQHRARHGPRRLPGLGVGRDPLAAEVARHVEDRRLLLGEGEVHLSPPRG